MTMMRMIRAALGAFLLLTVPTLACAVPAGTAPAQVMTETKAQKFRRLMTKAATSNPAANAPLSGAWPWPASTSVNAGAKFSNAGNVYVVTTAGTTAGSGGPTGYGVGITDGSATWAYIGPQTAPAVTNTTAALSGLTSTIPNTDARIRYGGGNTVSNSGGYAFWSVQQGSADTTCKSGTGTSYNQNGFGAFLEIETDAPKITFDFKQAGYFATVMVTDLGAGPGDARFVDASPVQLSANGAGHTYLNLDFTNTQIGTSRHLRRIRVDFGCNQVFFGIKVAPTDAVGAPSTADVIHAAFLGDSWTAADNIFLPTSLNTTYSTGSGIHGWRVGFAETLGRLLGWDDVWASGASGTGYLKSNATYSQAFAGRVADITSITANGVTYTPDVVVIMGGINDVTQTGFQAAVLTLIQNVRAAVGPSIPIIVLGYNSYAVSALALEQQYEGLISAAVTQAADPLVYFIPNVTATDTGVSGSPQGYITGSGNVGSPGGAGNSDFYVGTSASPGNGHPNELGEQYLARRYAAKIRQIIGLAPWSANDDRHWRSLAANGNRLVERAAA